MKNKQETITKKKKCATRQSTSAARMLIKLFKKIFALEESIFNIV